MTGQTAAYTASEEGDIKESGLETLYATHAPRALKIAFLMTGDASFAEDVVQDAFVRLTGSFRHLRSEESFGSYLNRTVINLTRDHFRRRKVERRHLEREGSRQMAVAQPSQFEDRDRLVTALRTLPHRQRAAVVLRYFEDLSERGVAHELGCSLSAAKSLIARGMDSLRAALEGVSDE